MAYYNFLFMYMNFSYPEIFTKMIENNFFLIENNFLIIDNIL